MARSRVVRAEEAETGARSGGHPCPGHDQDAGWLRAPFTGHSRRTDDGSARRAPTDGRKDGPHPGASRRAPRQEDRAGLAVLASGRAGLARATPSPRNTGYEVTSCTRRSPARLAAELALGGQLHEALRRRHALFAELPVHRLRRVHVHVDADEVDERARAERPAGRRLVSAASRSSARHSASSRTRTHSLSSGMRMRLTMKPGVSLQWTGRLPARCAHSYARSTASSLLVLRADDLDERQHGRRIEEVHADDALRVPVASAICMRSGAPTCSSRGRRPAA